MKTKFALRVSVLWCSVLIADNRACGQNWNQTTNFLDDNFSIAMSADGNKLVVTDTSFHGGVNISTNAGINWFWISNGIHWVGFDPIASSADGNKLAAGRTLGQAIYTSADGGYTWTSNNVPGASGWYSIASSADGNKLVASPYGTGSILTSTNTGITWTSNNVPITTWNGVASSADGTKLVATTTGAIYTSTNSGTSWTRHDTASIGWYSVASSADGNKLVAGVYSGLIHTSTNAGATWLSNNIPVSANAFYRVASSADGNKLAAAVNSGGPIYTSTNGGASWTSNSVTPTGWTSLMSSADGNKLAAAAYAGRIYISQATPTPALSLTTTGGNARLSWLIPSLDFTLQQNTDLAAPNWTEVLTPPVLNLTNLQNEVGLPLSPSSAFYRLKSSP